MARRLVAVTASLLLLWGCGTRYYLVQSRLSRSTTPSYTPEVIDTPLFRDVRARVSTVGLSPPDDCADQGIGGGQGVGAVGTEVISIRCGVEMAALEAALSRAGYEVRSWSAIEQEFDRTLYGTDRALRAPVESRSTLLDAARLLGIDVLLQVNALERVTVGRSGNELWERSFFKSNRQGERREPVSVSQDLADEFDQVITDRENAIDTSTLVAAVIDVSGIWVDTGTVMWFYRGRRVDASAPNPIVQAHIDCEDRPCERAAEPRLAIDDGQEQSGSLRAISVSGAPTEEGQVNQAVFAALFEELAADLATRFVGRAY